MFAARPLRLTAVRGLLAVPMLIASGAMVSRGQPASPPAAPAPPAGATGPMRVTTDTPEYCVELSERVTHAERTPAPQHSPEVDQLAAEGQHMCAIGLIRGGLLRLRRAWMLLRAGQ